MSSPLFTQSGNLSLPKRSNFDQSHESLLTGNMMDLIPVYWTEGLPNDTWKLQQQVLCRFQPILAPLISQVDVKFYWFNVPNRLIYEDWEKFISPSVSDGINITGSNVNISSQFTPPYTTFRALNTYLQDGVSEDERKRILKFCDYMNLPSYFNSDGALSYDETFDSTQRISLLPFMAYQRIWYDYFRDENVDDDTEMPRAGGFYEDSQPLSKLFNFRKKSWDKDYFTSALPFAQKGPQVTIPIGSSAEVSGSVSGDVNIIPEWVIFRPARPLSQILNNDDYSLVTVDSEGYKFKGGPNDIELTPVYGEGGRIISFRDAVGNSATSLGIETVNIYRFNSSKGTPNKHFSTSDVSLTADLTTATATTIDQFRTLFKLEKFFERAALVGTRYTELLRGFFGVTPSDARLQRAEYLGGCRIPVISNEVFSNSEQPNMPVGSYAGKANALGEDAPIKYFNEEHSILMCIMCVVPKSGYFQGLPRKFSERYDYTKYFWPQFAHLGEQEVKSRELFMMNDDERNEETFGYQSRYVEYKFDPDECHGDFRGNMDNWHLYRKFASRPVLNSEFLQGSPSKRIFAVTGVTDDEVDSLAFDIHFDIQSVRAMPLFAEPLLD